MKFSFLKFSSYLILILFVLFSLASCGTVEDNNDDGEEDIEGVITSEKYTYGSTVGEKANIQFVVEDGSQYYNISDFSFDTSGNEIGANVVFLTDDEGKCVAEVTATKRGEFKFTIKYNCSGLYVSEEFTVNFKYKGISNTEELKAIENSDGQFQLDADIDLGGAEWKPIEFRGELYGDGHTISNYKLEPLSDSCGFFGVLSGKIFEINFSEAVINTGINKSYVGLIAGKNKGVIDNCTVSGKLFANFSVYVGAIAGCNESGAVIRNSKNSAQVTGGDYVGGIAGKSDGAIESTENHAAVTGNKYVGGIAGTDQGTDLSVKNFGQVTGKADYVGGIYGYKTGKIDKATNSAEVQGECDYVGGVAGYSKATSSGIVSNAAVIGRYYVGGTFGYSEGDLSGFTNSTSVSGKAYVGGIVGKSTGAVRNSKNTGSVISLGTIIEDSKNRSYIGGIAGYCGTIEYCENSSAISAEGHRVGGLVGYCSGDIINSTNTAKVTGADLADLTYAPGTLNNTQVAIALESVQNALNYPFTITESEIQAEIVVEDPDVYAGGSNATAVTVYTGDVTALGFEEGTIVYEYAGVDSTTDKAAIKVDSVNYDYVDVQFVITKGSGYFFLFGRKDGNWYKSGTSYIVDPSWLRLGDGNNTPSDRVIEVYDAQGNKVSTLMNTNVLYTLRVYTKVGELDEILIGISGSTIYFANVKPSAVTSPSYFVTAFALEPPAVISSASAGISSFIGLSEQVIVFEAKYSSIPVLQRLATL